MPKTTVVKTTEYDGEGRVVKTTETTTTETFPLYPTYKPYEWQSPTYPYVTYAAGGFVNSPATVKLSEGAA